LPVRKKQLRNNQLLLLLSRKIEIQIKTAI